MIFGGVLPSCLCLYLNVESIIVERSVTIDCVEYKKLRDKRRNADW